MPQTFRSFRSQSITPLNPLTTPSSPGVFSGLVTTILFSASLRSTFTVEVLNLETDEQGRWRAKCQPPRLLEDTTAATMNFLILRLGSAPWVSGSTLLQVPTPARAAQASGHFRLREEKSRKALAPCPALISIFPLRGFIPLPLGGNSDRTEGKMMLFDVPETAGGKGSHMSCPSFTLHRV